MPKRIIILRFGWIPFIDINLKYMIDALCERGVEVTYIKSRSRPLGIEDEKHPVAKCRYFSLFCKRMKSLPVIGRLMSPFSWLEYAVRSSLMGLSEKPDLVTAYGLDSLLQAWLVARLKGAPLFYYSEELYTDRPGVKGKWFWNMLERLFIKKADLICTCEPNRSRVLQERYGLETTPLSVLNVPPRQEAHRTEKIQEYLRERGISAGKIIYFHGWAGPNRCADTFVEAMRYVTAPDSVLFFVGPVEEDFKQQMLERASKYGLKNRVVFRGIVPTEELMDYAASAHVGLQVQLNQGLNSYYCAPNKLFQYLAAGMPVIASNFPGMIEVVEKNMVGYCVDPEDPKAIAEAINRILGDETRYREMSGNATRIARERYCYEVEGQKLLDALQTLLDRTT